jgi:hypothetical protein
MERTQDYGSGRLGKRRSHPCTRPRISPTHRFFDGADIMVLGRNGTHCQACCRIASPSAILARKSFLKNDLHVRQEDVRVSADILNTVRQLEDLPVDASDGEVFRGDCAVASTSFPIPRSPLRIVDHHVAGSACQSTYGEWVDTPVADRGTDYSGWW